MADDCIFCKIAAGQIPVERVVEDEHGLAFPDLRPGAPTHLLVIPKRHVRGLGDAAEQDWPLIGRLHALAVQAAKKRGIDATGYRTVFNVGPDAGQSVFHMHLHVLGGRQLGWPPG